VPFATPTLRLTAAQHREIVAHCFDGLPDEACGLLSGPIDADLEPEGTVTGVFPCRNADASARTYRIDSKDHFQAMKSAGEQGGELIGVWHSHTHTDAYPSDTDVRQAFEPGWVYVLVSLKHAEPVTRAYRIRDGQIAEVEIRITGS
jgi:proteasome lid subunit RPN8/RPN11